MIRQFVTTIAATFSMAACAGPTVAGQPQSPEGLVIFSLTADAPANAHISRLDYRIRPVVSAQEGEQVARVERRSSSVNEQFRRAAADNARRAADNLRSRLSVLGRDVPGDTAIRVADKPVGRVLVLQLPPGEYELRDWSLSMRDDTGRVELSAPAGGAYRFTVVAGEQHYVGNVHLSVKAESRFSQSVSDARARDLDLAGALSPDLKSETVMFLPAQRVR